MSKDLVLNILLGVAIMVVTHIVVSLIFGDEFLDRSTWGGCSNRRYYRVFPLP